MEDLDSIFNLVSSLNNQLESDELVEDNNDDINITTEYPYVIFSRNDLIRTMNLCNKLVQPKSDITSYNSISFVPVLFEKKLYFYATNELSHFRMFTELIGNTSEMLDMDFSIPFIVLQRLVKLMGNKVLIYKKENNLYIRLLDGDLLLDLRRPSFDIIKFPGNMDKKLAELGVNNIGSIVSNILPLLSTDIRGESRRIYFNGEKAYFTSNIYHIESNIKSPKMTIALKDAIFISKLYKYYKDKTILFFDTKSNVPRIILKIDNIEYQFINSKVPEFNLMTQQLEKFNKEADGIINLDRFYKIINLSSGLPSSTGNIELILNKDGLTVSISSNKGNSDFKFTVVSNNVIIEKRALINAEILRRLLVPFYGNSNNIRLSITDIGIILECNNIKAIMMHII